MNATSQIQAVIFDLDGVITDTAEYHYQASMKAAGMFAVYISL